MTVPWNCAPFIVNFFLFYLLWAQVTKCLFIMGTCGQVFLYYGHMWPSVYSLWPQVAKCFFFYPTSPTFSLPSFSYTWIITHATLYNTCYDMWRISFWNIYTFRKSLISSISSSVNFTGMSSNSAINASSFMTWSCLYLFRIFARFRLCCIFSIVRLS